MIVGIRKKDDRESGRNVDRVEIVLEDGQSFIFRELNGILAVWTSGDLIVRPRAANVVRLEEVK